MYEITKNSFNYIDGAHGLLEYSENGTRYVACSLFGIVWYRVTICKDFISNYDRRMFLFLLDGEHGKHENKTIGVMCQLNGQIEKIKEDNFFNPYTIKIKNIVNVSHFLAPKIEQMTLLINGAIITIGQIKRYKKILEKLDHEHLGLDELKDIIRYQENIKMMALLCFYCIRNLPKTTYKEKELLNYFSKQYTEIAKTNNYDLILEGSFLENVTKGVNVFNYLIEHNLISK